MIDGKLNRGEGGGDCGNKEKVESRVGGVVAAGGGALWDKTRSY